MKNLLILVLLMLSYFKQGQSQTVYNCTYKQICTWNEAMESYDNCIGGAENATFEIDRAETKITQTLQNETTNYKIRSKERKNKSMNIYLILTAAEDKFYCILDSRKKEVRVLTKNDGKASLIVYSQGDPMLSKE